MKVINNQVSINYTQKEFKPNFTAHPDFYKLAKKYDIKASSYFRRGQEYGSASEDFYDIVKLFSNIFKKQVNGVKKMLIVGIADSQEPFSYLAVLKRIFKDTPISEKLDLYCVDLQSKPCKNKLFKDSFVDEYSPTYARSSFVFDEKNHGKYKFFHYRVNDDIFNYLHKIYNSKNSQWETRIQDVINDYPREYFDIISINNTIPYFLHLDKNGIATAKKLIDILKPNGVIITDTTYQEPYKGFEKLYSGIFRKISDHLK